MSTDYGRAVAYIRRMQLPNGSFSGYASTSVVPFVPEREQPTTFFTSLIATCLAGVPGTKDIRQKAATFLLSEKSKNWSWNYWQRSAEIAKKYPYPDDMDDTACAIQALHYTNPALINGRSKAHLAQLLINTENKPGGPYKTWLIHDDQKNQWSDTDIVVNANIGALLHIYGINLPGLNKFVDECLASNKLESPYYIGRVPALYFLSKWYQGSQLLQLKKYIKQESNQTSQQSILQLAMLLTAAKAVRLPATTQRHIQRQLVNHAWSDHWDAAALYVDPFINGSQYYAGSDCLTTAFVLEALVSSSEPKPIAKTHVARKHSEAVRHTLKLSAQLPLDLRKPYQGITQAISDGKKADQITEMANIVCDAYDVPRDPEVLLACNTGSLNGWIAYTIYDDIFDDESDGKLLGVANYAQRQAINAFGMVAPSNQAFHALIQQAFLDMDAANTWEVTHARCAPGLELDKIQIPDYKNYKQLAQRSAGHMLAACGVLYSIERTEDLRALQLFFYHFLIAKQLNDDAHDWQTDLQKGHISAVVAMVVSEAQKQGIKEYSSLSPLFWQSTIHGVVRLVLRHTRAAKRALQQTSMNDRRVLLQWIEELEEGSISAQNQSVETQEFIAAYQNSEV